MGCCGVYPGERAAMLKGFLCSIAIALSLMIAAAGGDEIIIEPTHATIESQEGHRLRVVFAAEDRPALIFKPEADAWDWSQTSRLVIPVENPGNEAVTLLLRLEDHESRSLTGKVAIAPRSAGNLAISIGAPPPRSMGMIAGPSPAAAGLDPGTLPVTATDGGIDASHVTVVRLGMPRPSAPQPLVVGPPRVEPDRTSYDGIVDGFGQFLLGEWPEKVSSAEMLRTKGAEEARAVAQWLADSPRRDRFGGLLGAGGFRATGFFRTEQRDGRWWLITPEGNAFFSIGMDVIALAGETYVDGREFMFRDLPAPDGELAAHWSKRDDRGGLWPQRDRSFDHGRAFNFYTANLERKFGPDWRERWREETAQRLEAWGFNTIGNWSEPDLWAMHRLPYTVPLWLAGFGGGESRILSIRGLPRLWMRWRGTLRRGSGATLGWSAISWTTSCLGGGAGQPIRGNITLSRSTRSLLVRRARRNRTSSRNSSKLIAYRSASHRPGAFRSPRGMNCAARVSPCRRRAPTILR